MSDRADSTRPTGRGASHYVTLRTPRQPYCPDCGVALTQQTTAIHLDIAWCINCADGHVDHRDWLGIAVTSPELSDTWTRDRGVRFWTPDRTYKDGIVEQYTRRRDAARARHRKESDAVVRGIEDGSIVYRRPRKPCPRAPHAH